MKVWEVAEEHCFGIALVAANSEEEAIKIVEEYIGENCPWTNYPNYYALESQGLIYNQDSPEILYNYLDV